MLVYKAGTNLREGIGYLEWALAAYQSLGDRPAAARTHSRLGMHLTTYPATLDVAAGLAHYQAAEADLARQPVRRQLGYLYVGMAMAAVFGVRTALLAAGSGQLEEGRAQLARCREIIQAGEDWRGLAGRVDLAAGMLAAAEGMPRKSGEAFASAVNTFHRYACSWDEAQARSLWARALPAEASGQHKAAAALYRRIGASRRWTAWAAGPVG